MKRQRRTPGDVVRVDLGNGFHSYARVLAEASFAVYDYHGHDALTIDQITSRPVLFVVAVMDFAVKKGRWPIVGNLPLEETLATLPPRFIQDPIRKDQFSIYECGTIRSATQEECVGLERAAVWDPAHVEDRIRDHHAGNVNKWLESLKMRA